MNKNFKIILSVLIILIALLIILFLFRLFSPKQLDDVSSQIPCDKELLDKGDVLFVIPKFNNVSIAENQTWCKYILSLNKTLAMHGVYHTYNEFDTLRDEAYINDGKAEFAKCFGFYPKEFKAPQLNLNTKNERLLKKIGFEMYDLPSVLLHKSYHCQDSGSYSSYLGKLKITNKFIDWV